MTTRRRFINQTAVAEMASGIPSFRIAEQENIFDHQETGLQGGKSQLLIGWASVDITPDKPVALVGQLHKRISEKVQDSLTATVLAMETISPDGMKEQAIMVSCDLIWIRAQTQRKLRESVITKLKDFDASKLFLNAIHTHTAPGLIDGAFNELYDTSGEPEVMKPSEYETYFIGKVLKAVIKAWEAREPGGFSWGLGYALLGHNRRTMKFDGTARMYGANDLDFSHYEGSEDNHARMLFFWDKAKSLTGIVINTDTTAQVTDSTNFISADFYHEARQTIKEKYGESIQVFIQVGAAGDITPANHEYIYKQSEGEMLQRKGITARQELANRLLRAVDEVMPFVKDNIEEQVIFKHTVAKVGLAVKNPPSPPFYLTDSVDPAEFHIIRLGGIAIATNPFELFRDYGVLIKARSKAILTFLIQLSCAYSGYLPTERAVGGGGYSADNYLVGPEGGFKLVEETVKRVNEMWD